MSANHLDFLSELEETIIERFRTPTENSYTCELFAAGPQRIAQKVGEEAIEVALASSAGDREETISETADLLYHVLVMLTRQEIQLSDVVAELQSRHKT